jgi:hypothetical protein
MNSNVKISTGGGAKKLFYGVSTFIPSMINPNKSTLSEFLGRDLEKEPEYLTTKDLDGKQVRVLKLDIWGTLPQAENTKTKITFWLEARHDISRSGKQKYINGQGLTSYNEDPSVMNKNKMWYYGENQRKAMVGEDTVVDFFINLKNWETDLSKYTMRDGDIPSIFLPLEKLFKQDYSDINPLFEEGRGIRVYVGIRSSESNGKTYYDMDIYTKAFIKDYPGAKNFDKIINALKGEYSSFKKNIAPITANFLEFDPNELMSEEADMTMPSPSNDMGFSDDLPF